MLLPHGETPCIHGGFDDTTKIKPTTTLFDLRFQYREGCRVPVEMVDVPWIKKSENYLLCLNHRGRGGER